MEDGEVKIITRGEKPEDPHIGKQFTCRECATVIEFEKSDLGRIKFGTAPHYDEYLPCPICNRSIFV